MNHSIKARWKKTNYTNLDNVTISLEGIIIYVISCV